MSYQYGQFIYGIPLPEGLRGFFRHPGELVESGISEARIQELYEEWEDDDEPFGIKFLYSSGGDRRDFGYLGVEFDHRNGGEDLDSCSPFRPRDLLAKTPKPSGEQMRVFQEMVLNLPVEIREFFTATPDVWVMWGSS